MRPDDGGIQAPDHTATMDLVERSSSSTRHPWEIARVDFFLRVLDQHSLLDGGSWLDAGAGDAWFAMQLHGRLPAEATITCWDVHYTAEDLEALRERAPGGMDVVAARPSNRFDRVLMLDVIEHVDDDVGFVSGIVDDLLAADGSVLVSVPAYESLYSSHDRALRHHRRYAPAGLHRVLERAGLVVVAGGGLFLSLLSARVGQIAVERLRPVRTRSRGVGDWRGGNVLKSVLTRVLVADGQLCLAAGERGVALPGLSTWALCRRAAR